MASCPKCKAKIGYRKEPIIAIPSSANRDPEGNAGTIYGYTCIICGHYVDIIEVYQPRVPETPQALARPSGPRTVENTSQARGLAIRAGVALHIERIRYLYSLGVNGSIVCKMLVDNGVYASEKTLRKHVRELLAK